jgi:phytoene dehydrogenase-like protein
MTTYDTILIGSSPNALTAAAYVARSGKRVLVLEPSAHVGGATATAPFADEYRADLSLTSGRIAEHIFKDLNLGAHGLEVIERDSVTSLLAGGRSFTLTADRAAATQTIKAFAPADASKYSQFMELLDLATDLLKHAYSMTPPSHPPSSINTEQLASLVSRLRGYGRREMTEVIRVLVMSARDFLGEWFESEQLKGLLAGPAVRGLTKGPFASGTTFNLLHHLAIGDGYFRATARGGIGAIAAALASAAKSMGAELRTQASVVRIIVVDGVATGAQLADGQVINAGQIICDYDTTQIFTKLVSPPDLEPEFNRAVQNISFNGSVARVNLALNGLPEFEGLSEQALRGTLTLAPSVSYIEKAYDRAKFGTLSEHPYMEATIPTLADTTLAPKGKHVMQIWVQYAPFKGQLTADQVRNTAIMNLAEFAPNLKSLVMESQVLTPGEYATAYNLTEGHLYGADMALHQTFSLRPIPGFSQYRTPIGQLYLCGSCTHPGGGISGISGLNAVKELGVKDLAMAAKD